MAVETEAGRMEKMEGHEGAALLVGAEKAVIEELGRKELRKVDGEWGNFREVQITTVWFTGVVKAV